MGAQYLSSRVFPTESHSSGGPGCVCFRFYRLFFKDRTLFGFVLNYNLLQLLQLVVFSKYLHVSKSHKTASATELLKLIDHVAQYQNKSSMVHMMDKTNYNNKLYTHTILKKQQH